MVFKPEGWFRSSGRVAHISPELRLRRTGIFTGTVKISRKVLCHKKALFILLYVQAISSVMEYIGEILLKSQTLEKAAAIKQVKAYNTRRFFIKFLTISQAAFY